MAGRATFASLMLMTGVFAALAGTTSATMTCTPDPFETVCTGDSGTDPYAFCDGNWVDVFDGVATGTEAQVCAGYAGDNHAVICEFVATFTCTDLLG